MAAAVNLMTCRGDNECKDCTNERLQQTGLKVCVQRMRWRRKMSPELLGQELRSKLWAKCEMLPRGMMRWWWSAMKGKREGYNEFYPNKAPESASKKWSAPKLAIINEGMTRANKLMQQQHFIWRNAPQHPMIISTHFECSKGQQSALWERTKGDDALEKPLMSSSINDVTNW